MYKKLNIFLALLLLFSSTLAEGKDRKETFAYKLAILHTETQFPKRIFSNGPIIPTEELVKEFQWIIDSIKHRSLNPEIDIADTIYGTWEELKKGGHELSLLDVARELLSIAKNTALFGTKKVNFRVTSKLWLVSIQTDEKIERIMAVNAVNIH